MKVTLCRIDEIPSEGAKTVDFFGREALVFIEDGRPKVILNICAHLGGPLRLEDTRLVCKWHGAEFDRRGGACLKGPARPDSRLITLPTRVVGEVLAYEYGD